jgi:prepilin-type N-terminal cleavage/methylation domain-containing protein
MRPTGTRLLARGFTLLEMLVTLTIVSFAAVLVFQALSQIARVERALEGTQLELQSTAVRVEWVRSVLESVLPLPEGDPERFRGSSTSASGLAAEVPGWPVSTTGSFSISLEYDAAGGAGKLILLPEAAAAPGLASRRLVVLEWEGPPGEMRYLTESGEWVDRWPAPSVQLNEGPVRAAPRAVAIRTGSAAWPLMVVSARTSGYPRPTRRQMDQL